MLYMVTLCAVGGSDFLFKNCEAITSFQRYRSEQCWFVGDQDGAEEAGTTVNGGQTILNPWMTVGGAATSICQPNEYIM